MLDGIDSAIPCPWMAAAAASGSVAAPALMAGSPAATIGLLVAVPTVAAGAGGDMRELPAE